jgi:hypothetical protein
MADEFIKALDTLEAGLPGLEFPHESTAKFVRGKSNVKMPFLKTSVRAVESRSDLQVVKKLDPVKGRDSLQFLDAFPDVLNRGVHLVRNLKYTLEARRAELAADALQIYAVAKAMSRDVESAELKGFVEDMERDLGRKGIRRKTKPAEPAPGTPAGPGKGVPAQT